MRLSDLHDRRIPRHWDSGPSYQWPTPRRLVDRLSADLGDACHSGRLLTGGDQLSGPGGTHAHSQSRNSFPRDLQLVGLTAQRPLQMRHPLLQLLELRIVG